VEIDRIDILLQSSVNSGIVTCSDLTGELRSAKNTATKIIDNLLNDLGQLGQADRDLQTKVISINNIFVLGEQTIKDNFYITEVTLFDALLTVVNK